MTALRLLFVVVLAAAALTSLPPDARAQPDSVRAEILKEKGFPPDHSPRKALLRGAAAPGWGQIYNRQYYKLPFVYAGLAGLGFFLNRANSRYKLFKQANLFVIGEQRAGEGETNKYEQFEPEFNRAASFFRREPSGEQLRNQRDQYRRQRNLSIVGIGVFYVLTLVDAYVSAHLLTFDVDDDLAVNVQPTGPGIVERPGPAKNASVPTSATHGMGMRVRVTF